MKLCYGFWQKKNGYLPGYDDDYTLKYTQRESTYSTKNSENQDNTFGKGSYNQEWERKQQCYLH